jgi:predicted transcriptional regulator
LRKRGWGTITVDILEAALTPQKKMRIMYKVNLNYDRFSSHFIDLVEKGFIVEADDPDGHPSYMISERGRTFLAALTKARELASSVEY